MLETYNETFSVQDFSAIPIVDDIFNDTSDDEIIGTIVMRKGKVIKYEIDRDLLWIQVIKIIYHRINKSGGTPCLLNLHTISKQIERECNIKSIAAIEGKVIELVCEKFGVKDINDPKEHRGLDALRNTITFWGTVGSRTKHNRKRLARLFEITDVKRIMKYIEGELNIG